MTEVCIRQLRFSCNRCGNIFLTIDNCIIPININNMILVCSNCSAVIKKRSDIVIERFEPENENTISKDLYNPEKYI